MHVCVCLSVCVLSTHLFFCFYLTACSVCRHLTKIGTTLARGKYGGVRAQSEITILIFTYIVEYTIVLKRSSTTIGEYAVYQQSADWNVTDGCVSIVAI